MLKAVQLGRNCGLRVSQLGLGTMNFGTPGIGHQADWTLDLEASRSIFRTAIENGLFYFDCAANYGLGHCEIIIGKLLKELLPRDEYVLETKIFFPPKQGPNQGGLSRKYIMEAVDAALTRLGHDYVDVLVIHRHPHQVEAYAQAPIEETLVALHDVVRAGKALYLGASSMFAWQFVELQLTAEMNGWTKFVTMQNHYNLLYREEEREMNPYCIKTGVALTPWSPLGRGILCGTYRGAFDKGSTARSKGQDRVRTESLYRGNMTFQIAGRVAEVAAKHGRSPAQIAMAWLLSKPGVTAPLVGISSASQIVDLGRIDEVTLEPDDVAYLEELYQPLVNLLSIGHS